MNFKEKSYEFMQKHPKFTKGFIAGSAALATIGSTGIVASAEGETGTTTVGTIIDIDAVTDTLVGGASSAFQTAIGKAVPVLGAVMGFNVVVRLVRRFIKG